MIAVLATRFAVTSLVSLIVAGAGLAPVARADQAAPGLDLSRDLVHWTSSLDDPVFLPGLPWEPGDIRTATFFVRNDSNEATDVAVALHREPMPAAAVDDLVTMSAGTTGSTVTVITADDSTHLVRVRDLSPGEAAPITLRAELSDQAPLGTQVDVRTLDFEVTPTEPADRQNESAGFASAAHLLLAPLFLGFAMTGAAFMVWNRNRKRGLRSP